MPWYQDSVGSQRGNVRMYALGHLTVAMNQHQVRGRRCVPQDIDFIVICRTWSEKCTVTRKRLMHMQMHRGGCRLVFELFSRMNVVKRCLQEPPQEREHTETDAADSHSFSVKIPPFF